MGIEYTTAGGVRKGFGPYTVDRLLPSRESTRGEVKELTIVFDAETYPDNHATDATNLVIPANAFILSVHAVALVGHVGGTSQTVGLQTLAGAEIDNDGLLDAGDLAIANVATAGSWVVGTGALIGASIGTAAGQIVVADTGTYTSGRLKVIVRYLEGV